MRRNFYFGTCYVGINSGNRLKLGVNIIRCVEVLERRIF